MNCTPLTEKTFDFVESCLNEKLRPIFLIYPSKKNFGISLSARMLKNYWLEDLNNQPNTFKTGDKIKITIPPNLISNNSNINLFIKVISPNNQFVNITFKPDSTNTIISLNSSWIYKYGVITDETNKLTKSNRFIECFNRLKSADSNKNPWVQFLGVKDTVTKAQLTSKVYFIVGRGNVEDSRNYIEGMGLKDLFKDGLIFKESLKDFADNLATDQERHAKINTFIRVFNDLFGSKFEPDEDELNISFLRIQEKLCQGNIDIAELRPLLNQFLEELFDIGNADKYKSLGNIMKILPEVILNDFDISLVKSVIIDGTEYIDAYSNTIEKLIALKIPVIVLSDYANYSKKRKELTKNFQRAFPKVFCLNWDKIKINGLGEIELKKQYLDTEAFRLSRKYLNQIVTIEAFNDDSNIMDKLFYAFEIGGLLRRVEGFEGIKNVYTIYLRPVVYWLKNIPGQIILINDVIDAVSNFKNTYNLIRNQLGAQATDIVAILDEFLVFFSGEEGLINNSKSLDNLPEHLKYFNQAFDRLAGNELPLTNGQLENTENQTLVFTGTPYEEVKQFYLRKAIFEDFENIYFLGFCKEAENVYQRFINDTISFNRSIHDSLPVNYVPFWESIVELETDVTYLNERCSEYKNEAEPIKEDIDFDEVQDLIELARYQVNDRDDFSGGITDKDTKVLVNILELDGNKSVFIKKTGARKLLVLKKNKKFDKSDWDEINPGDRVFTYVITRHDTLEMRGENTLDELVFKDLDIWYEKLKEMWQNFNESFIDLAEMLNKIKIEKNLLNSNPEPSNLRNWLHKERMINAPEKDNLKLILLAAKTSDVNDVSKKIMSAKRRVEKFDRKNRDDIKKQIEKYITKYDIEESDEFTLVVNSVSIVVKHGVVKHKMETVNLKMEQDKIGIIIKME